MSVNDMITGLAQQRVGRGLHAGAANHARGRDGERFEQAGMMRRAGSTAKRKAVVQRRSKKVGEPGRHHADARREPLVRVAHIAARALG